MSRIDAEDIREVNFQAWCPKCKHRNKPETDDRCEDCLECPSNYNTDRPVRFEEA